MRSASLLVLLLVAVAAAFSACGGGDDNNAQAERVIERFLELGQDPGVRTQVLLDQLPPGLPEGLPEYPGSTLIGSTVMSSENLETFGVLLESGDSLDEILLFYEGALDQDPWQVVMSTSLADFAALQFNKVDDANFVGGVIAQQSGGDEERSSIFLSAQIISETGGTEPEPFELGVSKPLPRGFPAQMPVYPEATITDTAWTRSSGNVDLRVAFLTPDAPRDVIGFYQSELGNKGWKVTDEPGYEPTVVLSFEGVEGDETWSGAISADLFETDLDYTQASLQLLIGTGAAQTPVAPAAPTP